LIEINLLPSGDKRRPTRARTAGVSAPKMPSFQGDPWMAGVGAALLVVILAVGFVWWRTDARITQLNAQIASASQDSVRLASTIELLETLNARRDTISQRITMIRAIDERRYVWPHILDEVSASIPAFTWLSRVTSVELPDGDSRLPAMTIEGNAGSTQALTRFMKNLEDSPFIRDVTLVTSEQVTEQGRTFQRFTLEARYEQPDTALLDMVPVLRVD
jgi:Tfp pilus assembly protein PilN